MNQDGWRHIFVIWMSHDQKYVGCSRVIIIKKDFEKIQKREGEKPIVTWVSRDQQYVGCSRLFTIKKDYAEMQKREGEKHIVAWVSRDLLYVGCSRVLTIKKGFCKNTKEGRRKTYCCMGVTWSAICWMFTSTYYKKRILQKYKRGKQKNILTHGCHMTCYMLDVYEYLR